MHDVIRWTDEEGLITLTIDDPTQSVNTLNDSFADSFAATLKRLESQRERLRGVILRSGKKSFLAGGDLNRLIAVRPDDRQAFLDDLRVRKARMRRLERLGPPVVAVLTGPALGGGLELALACHYRIGVNNDRTTVGLPEVTLGLLPGGGGITRAVWLLGHRAACELAIGGRALATEEAERFGVLDAVVSDEATALAQARVWILAHSSAHQPWDAAGCTLPTDSGPFDTGDDPARAQIARVAAATATVSFDQAQRLEAEALADLVVSSSAKRTIQLVFFDTNRLRRRARLDRCVDPHESVIVAPHPAARELLASRRPGQRLDVVSQPPAFAHGRPVTWVVADDLEAPAGTTGIVLRPDRYDSDGLVAEHLEPVRHEDRTAIAVLSAVGVLPIPVRSLAKIATAASLSDRLLHPEDFGVAAVRIAGVPPWTLRTASQPTQLQHRSRDMTAPIPPTGSEMRNE